MITETAYEQVRRALWMWSRGGMTYEYLDELPLDDVYAAWDDIIRSAKGDE